MNEYRVFTWDPKRFANPKRTISDLAAMNFKTVAIVDPGVKLESGCSVCDSGVKAGIFVKSPDGKLYTGRVWPGASVFPGFNDSPARKWWAGRISEFVETGLAGIWNDMNEPAVMGIPEGSMPDGVIFHRNGSAAAAAQVHNVFGRQMSPATREGLLQAHPDRRPYVLTRATFAGGQRYAAVRTGDNVADWLRLQDGIGTLLGMGASGHAFVAVSRSVYAGSGIPATRQDAPVSGGPCAAKEPGGLNGGTEIRISRRLGARRLAGSAVALRLAILGADPEPGWPTDP
jgi:alpha-glucosidase